MNQTKEDIEIIEIYDDIEIIEIDENIKKTSKTKKKFPQKTPLLLLGIIALIPLIKIYKIENKIINTQNNIVYSTNHHEIDFTLNEIEYDTINVNDNYEEKGAKVIFDGIDKTSEIIIDSSNVNTTKIGTYHVIYKYPINKNHVETINRTIKVVDNKPPTIKLLGSNIETLLIGEEFKDEGIIVEDNSKEKITNIIIEKNIDTQTQGEYYVNYKAIDKSGNEKEIKRKVIVEQSHYINTNTITYNEFNTSGIYIKGNVQDNSFKNKILLKNKTNGEEIIIDANIIYNHNYQSNINIDTLKNGIYEFYLINDDLELITNNMNDKNKIVRSHIKDKLITLNYDKNKVNMIVEDFKYQYDIVIDPGHGGIESGAANGKYIEKTINIEQSLYEKKRFEEHGLKVKLLRTTDEDYGEVMGNNTWDKVEQKAYAIGYYGSVSKITYSNHHNSSPNKTSKGWEIIVPSTATYEQLKIEHEIADEWSNMYIEQTDPIYRFYTKDYETATTKNKKNGEIYNFEEYYAVIRMPKKLFQVKNILYEGSYISNENDMWWYYDNENWKKLSEVKIKKYVESIGVDYINP